MRLRGALLGPFEGGEARIYALRRSHVDEGMHFQVIIIAEIERGTAIRAQPIAIAGAEVICCHCPLDRYRTDGIIISL